MIRHADCTVRNSFSQYWEDQVLLPTLLQAAGGQPGAFVELGAFTGIALSNTLLLERCFGWRGLLIEANPSNYASLVRANRTATTRHSAVCSPRGMLNVTVSGHAVSGSPVTMASSFLERWSRRNRPEQQVAVPCQPLASLMDEAGLRTASFLSLDVEGAEAMVLQAADLTRFLVISMRAITLKPLLRYC